MLSRANPHLCTRVSGRGLGGETAAGYDRAFAHVSGYFIPFMLRAAGVAPGMRVLDIATGTGLARTTKRSLLTAIS